MDYTHITSSLYRSSLTTKRRHQSAILAMLARKYHGIGPLVIKVEGLVVLTNTGRSPNLERYYQYWERRMFDSLVKV